MSYVITEEDKNSIRAGSVYSLPISPSERGYSHDMIKKAMYSPIEKLISILNNILNSLGGSCEQFASGLEEVDAELEVVRTLAQNALSMAKGKSTVTVTDTLNSMFEILSGVKGGDMIFVLEENVPDFMVYSLSTSIPDGFTVVSTASELRNVLSVGGRYSVPVNVREFISVVAVESGIDTSEFALKRELESIYSLGPIPKDHPRHFRTACNINDLYRHEDCGVYAFNYQAVANGLIRGLPSSEEGFPTGGFALKLIVEADYVHDFPTVHQTLKARGDSYDDHARLIMFTRVCINVVDGVPTWSKWHRFVSEDELLQTRNLAQNAFNLATGKNRTYVYGDARTLFFEILNSIDTPAEDFSIGDFMLIVTKNQPDFIVYSTPNVIKTPPEGFIEVRGDNYLTVSLEAGVTYAFANSFVLIGIESGIDTSEFVTTGNLTEAFVNYTDTTLKNAIQSAILDSWGEEV